MKHKKKHGAIKINDDVTPQDGSKEDPSKQYHVINLSQHEWKAHLKVNNCCAHFNVLLLGPKL